MARLDRRKTGYIAPEDTNSQFKEEYCEKLVNMGKKGKSVAEFCADVSKSERTFLFWRQMYPQFQTAYEHYITNAKAYWSKLGHANVINYFDPKGGEQFDTNLFKFITGGRFGMSHNREIDDVELGDGDATSQHRRAIKSLLDNKLSPQQALAVSQMLLDSIKIEEYVRLTQRVAELEKHTAANQSPINSSAIADEPEYEEETNDV